MDFEPVLCDMDECTYVLKDTPETMEKYPFHFELEITHRLKGRTIETSWTAFIIRHRMQKDMRTMLFRAI